MKRHESLIEHQIMHPVKHVSTESSIPGATGFYSTSPEPQAVQIPTVL